MSCPVRIRMGHVAAAAVWGPHLGLPLREAAGQQLPHRSALDGDAARALQDVSDRLARVALGCPLGTHDEAVTLGEEEGALLRAVSVTRGNLSIGSGAAMKEQNQALLKEVKEVIGAQVSHSQQPQTKQQLAGSHKLTIANNRVTILRNVLQPCGLSVDSSNLRLYKSSRYNVTIIYQRCSSIFWRLGQVRAAEQIAAVPGLAPLKRGARDTRIARREIGRVSARFRRDQEVPGGSRRDQEEPGGSREPRTSLRGL
ncbi:unnamed protein product [Lampetra planeri]